MRKKVLVTGGAGFIGSNIVKLLYQKEYEIVVYDNLSTGYKKNLDDFPEVKLVVADIRDRKKLDTEMNGCEMVFHLAGSIGNVKSLLNPIEDSDINVCGTLNVLESARSKGVKKLVFSSSAAIFGELQYQPIDEKHPLEPDSPYGVSKLAAEKHCLWFGRTYDIDVVCLRYFNAYGNNQRYDEYGNVIPIWATLLLSDQPITVYGNGEQTRDFVDVKDIAAANILAAEKDGLMGAFNIGCGESITINYLAEMMKNIVNKDAEMIYAPPRKGEILHCLADISLAKTSFGFTPSTEMYENLVGYIAWIKSERSR
jgi:nucleoside-diphosphate-sugar epimerase